MAREFEIIGAGAVGALLHRKPRHAPEPGALCLNCGAELQGVYCHVCGQEAGDHHRTIGHVIWDGIEGLTHLDGRLGQTLPPLFIDPGRLARDHLEGRRQRHVPPFRLFLISLLIFMLVLETAFHPGKPEPIKTLGGDRPAATIVGPGGSRTNLVIDDTSQSAPAMGRSPSPTGGGPLGPQLHKGRHNPFSLWLREHLKRAIANQDYYKIVLFTWAHRMAILLLPILAGLLALVYVRRKEFYIYDQLVVAMQFLSFEFLVFAIAWLIPAPARNWALVIATLWTPVNFYMILRGAYRSRVVTAAIKTLFLWASTLVLFAVLMTGLLTLALAEM